MPVDTMTQVFAVQHCQVAPVLTDPAGAAMTWGTWKDVPGIKTLELTGTMSKKVLRGDNRLITQRVILDELSCKIDNAKLSLDVLVVMLGGTVTQSGATPNGVASWSLLKTAKPLEFGLVGTSAAADSPTGAVQFILPKCTLSKYPDMGLAEEDFRVVSAEMAVLPPTGTTEWLTARILETYTPPAPWTPETGPTLPLADEAEEPAA